MNRLALASLFGLLVTCGTTEQPIVEDAWVRPVRSGTTMTAAYFTLTNPTGYALTLIGAESPDFASVSIHETTQENDVSRMRPVESISIDTGEKLTFRPMGKHLMLMQPKGVFFEGDVVEFILKFDDGTVLSFDAPFEHR